MSPKFVISLMLVALLVAYNTLAVDGFFLTILCLKRSALCPLGFTNTPPVYGQVLISKSKRKDGEDNKHENNDSGKEDDYDDYMGGLIYED